MQRVFTALLVLLMGLTQVSAQDTGQPASGDAPHIFLDKSPAIVAYQLRRLTNAQLIALERHDGDARYKPVYQALLTRKGIDKKYRDEAVAALAKLDHANPVIVILNAIANVDPEDAITPHELIGMLLSQPPAALSEQRDKIRSLATDSSSNLVNQAAYAALAVGDGKPDQVWQFASSTPDGIKLLLQGIPWINDPRLRGAFFDRVNPLVTQAPDQPTRIAAIDAISVMPAHESDVFKELAGIVSTGPGPLRVAAVRSIRRIPRDKWPDDQLEPLARQIVTLVQQTPPDQRTTSAIAQAVQLGNDLAGELVEEQGIAIRKSLRELGVRVVVIRTIREQMQYDTRYFAVQAGKPVQIVLENADAMPHNLVITSPGTMQEVAVAAGAMPSPADNITKAYVPDTPNVLASLSMVQPDASESLSFTAPSESGEYDYVCTFPGHWVRMYGVMLVVPDLDAWEKAPHPPNDPLTHKAMESPRNEIVEGTHQH